MSRSVVALIIVVLLAGGAVLLFRNPPPPEESTLAATEIALTGHHEDGTRAWSIEAQTGSLQEETGALEKVSLAFFKASSPYIAAQGDRLVRTSEGSTLSGAVHIEQEETLALRTESIFWDERNSTLESGPVNVVMDRINLQAGGFHHDLNANVSTLIRGIEAQLAQGDKHYALFSDSADATSERIALYGDVRIEDESGSDQFRCQRLESDPSGESVRLIGDVTCAWNDSTFAADHVKLDNAGIRLRGNVRIELNSYSEDISHDA